MAVGLDWIELLVSGVMLCSGSLLLALVLATVYGLVRDRRV